MCSYHDIKLTGKHTTQPGLETESTVKINTRYTLHDSRRERGAYIIAIHDIIWSAVTDNRVYLRQTSHLGPLPADLGQEEIVLIQVHLSAESVRAIPYTGEHTRTPRTNASR